MKEKIENRDGMTLVELLVVIAIMMILAAIVLPQLEFGSESHKIRESARIVSSYLSVARNKAIETGRSCGVFFERVDDNPNASIQMIQVETPAPYAGDSVNSRVQVWGSGPLFNAQLTGGSVFPPKLIRLGDLIQFANKGPWYEITNAFTDDDGFIAKNTSAFQVSLMPGNNQNVPWPAAQADAKPVSFQIQRQPVSDSAGQTIRSMTPPQRLPAGTAIDLTVSGIGSQFFAGAGTENVAIMFDSNGAVKTIYCLGNAVTPIEPIYLLVGQDLQVPGGVQGDPNTQVPFYQTDEKNEEERPNWQNPDSRWVMLSPSTGVATVAQNMPVEEAAKWGISIGDEKKVTLDEVQRGAIPKARQIASEGLDGGDRR